MRRKKDWILRTRFSRIFFSGASHSRIRSSLRQKRFIDLPLIRGIPRFERVNAKGREGGGAEARGRSETKEEEEGTRAGWCRIVWQLFFPVISRRHRQIQPRDRSQKLVSCLRSSSSSSSHPSRDRHNESHWQPLINTILNTVLRFLGKGWSCFWDKADARSSSPRSDDHPSLRPLTFRLEKRSNRECFFSFFPSLFPSKKIPFSSVMSFSLKLFFRSLSSRTGSLFPDVTKQSLENGQISLEHGVGTHFTTDNRPTFSTMIHDRRGWSPPRAITFPLLIADAEKTDCNLSSVIGLIIKTGENYLSTISSSISSKPIGKLSIDPFRFETIRKNWKRILPMQLAYRNILLLLLLHFFQNSIFKYSFEIYPDILKQFDDEWREPRTEFFKEENLVEMNEKFEEILYETRRSIARNRHRGEKNQWLYAGSPPKIKNPSRHSGEIHRRRLVASKASPLPSLSLSSYRITKRSRRPEEDGAIWSRRERDEDGDDDTHNTCTALYATIRGEKEEEKEEKGEEEKKGVGG